MYCGVYINILSLTDSAVSCVDAGGVWTFTMTMSTDSADIKRKENPCLLARDTFSFSSNWMLS